MWEQLVRDSCDGAGVINSAGSRAGRQMRMIDSLDSCEIILWSVCICWPTNSFDKSKDIKKLYRKTQRYYQHFHILFFWEKSFMHIWNNDAHRHNVVRYFHIKLIRQFLKCSEIVAWCLDGGWTWGSNPRLLNRIRFWCRQLYWTTLSPDSLNLQRNNVHKIC